MTRAAPLLHISADMSPAPSAHARTPIGRPHRAPHFHVPTADDSAISGISIRIHPQPLCYRKNTSNYADLPDLLILFWLLPRRMGYDCVFVFVRACLCVGMPLSPSRSGLVLRIPVLRTASTFCLGLMLASENGNRLRDFHLHVSCSVSGLGAFDETQHI